MVVFFGIGSAVELYFAESIYGIDISSCESDRQAEGNPREIPSPYICIYIYGLRFGPLVLGKERPQCYNRASGAGTARIETLQLWPLTEET